MRRKSNEAAAYSRVSARSQIVLPSVVRDALEIKPGDTIRYLFTERGVVIEKAPAERDDPFATFCEWSSEHDAAAYGAL